MVLYGTDGLETRAQAYDLLAIAAKEHWGLSPLPQLVRAPLGKPSFASGQNLEFNLSHSKSFALCALDHAPVGVDIQLVKSWRPSLPRRVCSPEELEWLEQQDDFWRGFTALWAMKESRVKQSGQGLRGSIAAISVPLPRPDETLYAHQGLWFRLYFGPDWVGSACGTAPPPEEIHWRILTKASPASTCCRSTDHREKDASSHDF